MNTAAMPNNVPHTQALLSTPAPSAATDSVLNTYELLESIILALPPEDILLAASVCRTWYNVARRSVSLKARLIASLDEKQKPVDSSTKRSCFAFKKTFGTPDRILAIRRLGEVEVFAFLSLDKDLWLTLGDQASYPGKMKFERQCSGCWIVVFREDMDVTEIDWIGDRNKSLGRYLGGMYLEEIEDRRRNSRQRMLDPSK